jgi:hypothetical protein
LHTPEHKQSTSLINILSYTARAYGYIKGKGSVTGKKALEISAGNIMGNKQHTPTSGCIFFLCKKKVCGVFMKIWCTGMISL